MRYLCLINYTEAAWNALSPAARDAIYAETATFNAGLRQSGHYVASECLWQHRTAPRGRVVRDGRISITDGPFIETKEQLAGFLLVEAASLDEAVRIAARIPSGRLGFVDVRPTDDYSLRAAGQSLAHQASSTR